MNRLLARSPDENRGLGGLDSLKLKRSVARRVFALNNATHHAHSLRVGGVTRVPEVGRLEHCPPFFEKLAVQNCSTYASIL
jgi:hypothetical protein